MTTTDGTADGEHPRVHLGEVHHSAVNIGDHGSAHTTNVTPAAPPEPAQQQLLAAVRELRTDLARLVRNEQTEALATELAATEEEITASGAAGPGRLRSLHDRLGAAGSVAAVVGSGVAVAQALSALLGG